MFGSECITIFYQHTDKGWRTVLLLKCCGFMLRERTLFSCLWKPRFLTWNSLRTTTTRKRGNLPSINAILFDRILKDPSELSGPEYNDDDTFTCCVIQNGRPDMRSFNMADRIWAHPNGRVEMRSSKMADRMWCHPRWRLDVTSEETINHLVLTRNLLEITLYFLE